MSQGPGSGKQESVSASGQERTLKTLAAGVQRGSRVALARAITLVESTRPDHQKTAQALLARLLPLTGNAVRLGLSGAPGVGKSTFIEAFGCYLTGQGLKVAVLAVDPSSSRTGGSVLGDKTRMDELARDRNAFIRPSPAGGRLGGVARRTREAMLLTEAAGFNVVIIETVGVGQSETAVAEMVDMFLLLLSPGAGDELQGIKRGIMELADLVVVNKADGDLEPAARRAAAHYGSALRLIRPRHPCWTPVVLLASALGRQGLDDIWDKVVRYREALTQAGSLKTLRASQSLAWMHSALRDGLWDVLHGHEGVAARLPGLEADVAAGIRTPAAAARIILAMVTGASTEEKTGEK